MLIRGLDFSLSKSNPLVEGDLDRGSLRLERVQRLARGAAPLEGLLRREGSWILGVDFPFGFPTAFLDEVDWGSSWEDYVRTASSLEKSEFVDQICRFREPKPELQKHPKRLADRLARSQSPLTTDYVPVARMFWAGARHLVEADCDVVPFRLAGKGRVVVEAYPALVARRLIGGNKNKDGPGDGRTAEARSTLIALIERGELSRAFGFEVTFGAALRAEWISDEFGDVLDSAFCAIQASWAYGERGRNWGAPAHQQLEGWIPDPSLVEVDEAGAFVPIPEGAALSAPSRGSFNSSKRGRPRRTRRPVRHS